MKVLFAYYSLEGNCRALSQHMAEAVGGKVEELKLQSDDMPTGIMGKYLAGGKRSLMKEAAVLQPPLHALEEFDLIVVGGPVWAWGMTPAVRGFLGGNDWTGKKMAVFSMHRGGKGCVAKSMADLARERGGEVIGLNTFVDLRHGNAEKTKADAAAWAETLVRSCAG